MDGNLGEVFHDPKHPAGYSGPWKLWQATGQKREKVDAFLQGEDAYTLHKPAQRKFKRNVVYSDNIDDSWQMDLTDFRSIKKSNRGYAYILCVVDVFSKYGWAIPLKDKTGESIVQGFKIIFQKTSRRPTRLFSDKGKEFINQLFQKFLKQNDVKFIHSHNPDIKCSVVERWQRTIKTRLFKIFTATESECYVDGVLDKVVYAYNHSYHRSIKMRPVDVTPERVLEVYKTLYHDVPFRSQNAKYNVGDHVRISREKHKLEKGYTTNWSEEIFKIVEVILHGVPVYRIQDLDGDPIEGSFYQMELQKVAKPESFKIAYIVRSKGTGNSRKHFVHWKGYPEKSRSWVLDSDLVTR